MPIGGPGGTSGKVTWPSGHSTAGGGWPAEAMVQVPVTGS
ncbi:hypothetical protein GA0115240_1352115 [Streptomyces sp. DvalAA-14]|nr:hypothetical protein GA0115240_1352115 [Streptomyces sp. DvalAA-14]